ncbi:hypothetical protein JHK87_024573 [Glycine soja]|nr:hypothetical protein JHK87_024573 [Glycine soja]
MAFMISRAELEAEKSSLKHMEDKDSNTLDGVSSQLQLKSSLSSKASSQTLNRQQTLLTSTWQYNSKEQFTEVYP